MTLRNFIGSLTLLFAPLLIGAAAYFLYIGMYLSAFVSVLCVVVCMELRVRAGWRMPRALSFYAHVLAGAALLASLGALAWRPMPEIIVWLAAWLLLFVALSGGRLLVRQYV